MAQLVSSVRLGIERLVVGDLPPLESPCCDLLQVTLSTAQYLFSTGQQEIVPTFFCYLYLY